MKTAAQMKKENSDAARNLPVEVKKTFWRAMTEEGMNVGEARKLAGIDEIMVAAELVIQLHDTVHFPMKVDEIKGEL